MKRYKERKRERFLSPEETERLGEVLQQAEAEMPSAVAAFRLLLLTGCRLSEIQFLRWEYVKDDCIELPDAKTGGRVVPLGPEARAVLADLSREDGNTEVELLSGDRVDVVSIMEDRTVAIEVKSKDSDWFDLRRGVYQCVKYRAVMKAQDIRRNANVESWLVTETPLSDELKKLARRLGVRTKAISPG